MLSIILGNNDIFNRTTVKKKEREKQRSEENGEKEMIKKKTKERKNLYIYINK